ncbi:hypothetical protein C8R48DRAFT_693982 [Suillus tomentosus]|nr:hypothetical protein C8R48DRAFT_693982 [Suillus tomentosus]
MAPSRMAECQKPILPLFFLLVVALLPSILKLQSYGIDLLIANVYYLIFWAPYWFVSLYLRYTCNKLIAQGLLVHDWGCATQFFNWVVHLTYIISMSGIQIFSVPMVAVLLLILFPDDVTITGAVAKV